MLLLVAGCTQQTPVQQGAKPQQPATTANSAASLTIQSPATTKSQNLQNISILNYAFVTPDITVKAGTTVTWVNNDFVPHKLVAAPGSDTVVPAFGSQDLSQGQSYSYTFNTAGTFDYICQIHPTMTGRVTVTQ